MEAGGLPSGLPINRGWPARPLCPSPPTLSHRVPRLFPKQTPKNLLGETQFAWESQAKVSLGKGTAQRKVDSVRLFYHFKPLLAVDMPASPQGAAVAVVHGRVELTKKRIQQLTR